MVPIQYIINFSKFENQETPEIIELHQQKIGVLVYALTVIRPDISRTVNHLAEFMINAGSCHDEVGDRCLLYLYHIKNL